MVKKMMEEELEIPIAMYEKYGSLEKKLGHGSAGTVYKTSKGFAVKIFKFFDTFILESSLMNYITSPYCLKLFDAYKLAGVDIESKDSFFIVMPLGRGMEHDHIPLNPIQKFREVARGVYDLHAQDVIHGDIKPHNCIEVDGKTYLTDYGLSIFHQCVQRYRGNDFFTLWWRSPNLLLGQNIQKADDIWALGILLYNWLTGINPFESYNEINHLLNIFKIFGVPDNTWSGVEYLPKFQMFKERRDPPNTKEFFNAIKDPDARDLLKWMLKIDPAQRPTINEVFHHPFIGGKPKVITERTGSDDCYLALNASLNKELTDSFAGKNFYNNYSLFELKLILGVKIINKSVENQIPYLAFGHGLSIFQWVLNNKNFNKISELFVYACAAVYISLTLYDYSIDVEDWMYVYDGDFTREQFNVAIEWILNARKFDFIWSSSASFILRKYPFTGWSSKMITAGHVFQNSWYTKRYSAEDEANKIIELYEFSNGGPSVSDTTKKDIQEILDRSTERNRKRTLEWLKELDYET